MSDNAPEPRDPGRSDRPSKTPVNRPPGPANPVPASPVHKAPSPAARVPAAPYQGTARPKRTSAQIRADMDRQRHELSHSVDHLRDRVTEITDWRSQIKKHRRSIVIGAVATGFVVGGMMALRRR